MPPVPQWFQRVPQIIEEIEQFPAEVLDRATLEKIFRVRRRTAINLMSRLGGYQAGRTFLVTKKAVLTALQSDDGISEELHRKQRLRSLLRREPPAAPSPTPAPAAPNPTLRVKLPARPALTTFSSLPAAITLEPGELRITFADSNDLLANLALLAEAASIDLDGLEARTTPPRLQSPEQDEMKRLFAELEELDRQRQAEGRK